MQDPIIRLRGVHKSFLDRGRRVNVLRGVDFEVCEGEFVAIHGKSGSGKTTLLNTIAGFLPPDGGKAVVSGLDIYQTGDGARSRFRNENIGFIFQQFFLVRNLTCEENLGLPGLFSRMSSGDLERRLEEVLEMMELKEMRGRYPATLSGGQQQRIAVGRALLMKPRILLCDEPIGDLDKETGTRILNIFKDLSVGRNITVLVVTHMERVSELSDRTLYLIEGKLHDRKTA